MWDKINPKVVGASVIGFALVAGAYVITNFGQSNFVPQEAAVKQSSPSQRVAIAVEDADNNGIEDWRDAFVSTEITIPDQISATTYEEPETLSGQMGIRLMEGIINSRLYAPFAPTDEEVVTQTANLLDQQAGIKFFDTSEIDIMTEWDDEDIRNYANTLAAILYRYSSAGLDNEMTIMNEMLRSNDLERVSELQSIRDIYGHYIEDTLKVPVPEIFAKAHLDLINTYQAIYEDIDGMSRVFDDPAVGIIHLNRYSDDALGLKIALSNIYLELEEYSDLFTAEDPALLFVLFSPDYQPSF
jgi:hypothetical protein